MQKISIEKFKGVWNKKICPMCCICGKRIQGHYWLNINSYLMCFCELDLKKLQNKIDKILKEAE